MLCERICSLNVADFECSVEVVGTGFWRAPEILRQLKDRKSGAQLEFSKACDVYSFGMVAYEIVTGRLPFEEHALNEYDIVLNGQRPKLPQDLHYAIRDIITKCWHPEPSKRPTFRELRGELHMLLKDPYIAGEEQLMSAKDPFIKIGFDSYRARPLTGKEGPSAGDPNF